jgi:hypothetical protein
MAGSVTSTGIYHGSRHEEVRSETSDTAIRSDDGRAPTINEREPERRVESNASFENRFGLRGNFKSRTGNEAKNFFRVGRVFGIFIHEQDTETNIQSDAASTMHLLSYNDHLKMNIRSHFTRYVVVKEGSVFCWGVPISSYGRRGMHKFRNNPAEVRAHAIIHTSPKPRTLVLGGKEEPVMTKESIKVIPAHADDDDCLLSAASRLNFSRPRTIDHNLKAVNIGKVAPECMLHLAAYWDEQARSNPRRL